MTLRILKFREYLREIEIFRDIDLLVHLADFFEQIKKGHKARVTVFEPYF